MIRKLQQSDRDSLEKILRRISTFNPNDVEVALELIDIAITVPSQTDYYLFVYEEEKNIYGYYCIGKRPLTDAVYDLYWIVVDPLASKKGIGSELLLSAENFVRNLNGRWFLAETSSKESYTKTRNFYLKNNFEIVTEIQDFYSLGDSLMIFGKYLWNKN